MRTEEGSGVSTLRNPITGIVCCCARAVSGRCATKERDEFPSPHLRRCQCQKIIDYSVMPYPGPTAPRTPEGPGPFHPTAMCASQQNCRLDVRNGSKPAVSASRRHG